MNRYHRYQNVNSYWYDEVPEHWKKTKNKYVFHQDKKVVGSSWEDYVLLTMGKSGVKPRDMEGGGKFPASFENYQVVTPNQIIFCLFDLDETPRTVGKSSDHGMITSAYDVFSTTPKNYPQFWTYFYQMIDDHKGLRPYYTGLRKVVRSETFMGIEVFSPPIEEQKLISRYLDKKTSQIDSLVEKIQKKIKLLKEQRTSLINHYVTKGLDPNVEVKESGVEWIGEIPKHWEIKNVKYLLKNKGIKIGPFGSALKLDTLVEDGIKIYGQGNVIKNDFTIGQRHLKEDDFETNFKQYEIFPGDVLVTMMGTTGRSKVFEKSFKKGILDSHLLRLRFDHNQINPNLFSLLLENASYISHQIKLNSKGSIMEGLNSSIVKNISLILPNIEQQDLLLSKLSELVFCFEKLISKKQKKISFLREYRQSLISSVVTGKVRVTEDMT